MCMNTRQAKPAALFAANVSSKFVSRTLAPSVQHSSRHCLACGRQIAMGLQRQKLSPTANLLRNSRLFSLPNPLPRPPIHDLGINAANNRASESATLPFPTHQAIVTTPKSLARGDWGFKRPLPARSRIVQGSSPVVKLHQLDTIEHVTDYESATDHVRTRQKFEALSIPMLRGMSAIREYANSTPLISAFESWSDVTSYDEDRGLNEAGKMLEAVKQSLEENVKAKFEFPSDYIWTPVKLPREDKHTAMQRHNARRWKHGGPWIPGMSADEFARFVNKELSARKKEFSRYLRHYAKSDIYTARKQASSIRTMPDDPLSIDKHLEQQEDINYEARMHKEWSNISDEEIDARINKLRLEVATDPIGSKLVVNLIVPFLRIPAIKLKDTTYSIENKPGESHKFRFDDDIAPLSTHPSAGLGYLRSNAYITNHPILGPQAERTPVKARVIETRTASSKPAAKFGVAGFVAIDDHRVGSERVHQINTDPAFEIDIKTPGGAKVDVNPRFGSITNDGRVHLKLQRASGPEIQVAKGELEERPPVVRSLFQKYNNDLLSNLSNVSKRTTELNENSPEALKFLQFATNPDAAAANPFAGTQETSPGATGTAPERGNS